MNFTERYKYLKEIFSTKEESIVLNDTVTKIRNMKFISDFNKNDFIPWSNRTGDKAILENTHFSYPVFVPHGKKINDKAIILVHGLNEKIWNKYLTWAENLCENTGKSVILFPISYHMNRAPERWTDPREMSGLKEIRKSFYPDLQQSTIVNLSLSERLTSVPQRFFLSGYNYAEDLIKLIKKIKSGRHPLFSTGTKIDFFAYSIGVFLIQCLMVADPEDLMKNSKFVFFAGGSLFCDMKGISKYIMDNKAFERIHNYYLNGMEEEIEQGGEYAGIFMETNMGKAFRTMIRPDRFQRIRENVVKYFKPSILLIALRDDQVVPLSGILNVYGKNSNINIMHFKFPYLHENPFPVNIPEVFSLVDKAFKRVFTPACAFLM